VAVQDECGTSVLLLDRAQHNIDFGVWLPRRKQHGISAAGPLRLCMEVLEEHCVGCGAGVRRVRVIVSLARRHFDHTSSRCGGCNLNALSHSHTIRHPPNKEEGVAKANGFLQPGVDSCANADGRRPHASLPYVAGGFLELYRREPAEAGHLS